MTHNINCFLDAKKTETFHLEVLFEFHRRNQTSCVGRNPQSSQVGSSVCMFHTPNSHFQLVLERQNINIMG